MTSEIAVSGRKRIKEESRAILGANAEGGSAQTRFDVANKVDQKRLSGAEKKTPLGDNAQ